MQFRVKFFLETQVEINFFNIFKPLIVYLLHVYYLQCFLSLFQKQSPGRVPKYFSKFTTKHLDHSVAFSKVACLRTATLSYRVSGIDGSLWILESFEENVFYRTPLHRRFCVLQQLVSVFCVPSVCLVKCLCRRIDHVMQI